MTREKFLAAVEETARLAALNFSRDGYLMPAIIGFDRMGHRTVIAGVNREDLDDEALAQARENGTEVLPLPLRENQAELMVIFETAGCVAAVSVHEAWLAKDAVALDVIEMDILPSEHPSRMEVISVAGSWPREFAQRVITLEIVRDGHAATLTPVHSDSADLGGGWVGWLETVLPQPY